MARSSDYRNLADRIDGAELLDPAVEALANAAAKALPRGPMKDLLHGVPLGHPLHPLLTDLPIGFWTSAFVLDLVPSRRARPVADGFVALGVLAALPTIAAGAADWSESNTAEQRSGLVHAAANTIATGLYTASWLARRRGRRARGVMLAMAGATAATAGGYLGGHLTYRRASGVNQSVRVPSPQEWTRVKPTEEADVTRLDDEPLFHRAGSDVALADRCSHQGGPLHDGEVDHACVRCPWHGSTFRLADGAVVHGPATAPQPAFESRRSGDDLEVRRLPTP